MGQFLYFLPDCQAATPGELAARGLADRLPPNGCKFMRCAGPGGAGVLLTSTLGPQGQEAPLVYEPDQQTWFAPPGSARAKPGGEPVETRTYWLGFWRDDPPRPKDLARPDPLDGRRVKMADGNDWLAPIARRFAGRPGQYVCELPGRYTLDPATSEIRREVLAAYRRLWDVSGRAAEIWIEPFLADVAPKTIGATLTYETAWDAVACALGANYRLGFWEVMALGLADDNCMTELLQVLTDFHGLLDLLAALGAKKNAAGDTSSGTPGGEDSTPNTPPAGPTNTP